MEVYRASGTTGITELYGIEHTGPTNCIHTWRCIELEVPQGLQSSMVLNTSVLRSLPNSECCLIILSIKPYPSNHAFTDNKVCDNLKPTCMVNAFKTALQRW